MNKERQGIKDSDDSDNDSDVRTKASSHSSIGEIRQQLSPPLPPLPVFSPGYESEALYLILTYS